MAGQERGRGTVLFLKTVADVGGQAAAVIQSLFQLGEVADQGLVVGGG